MPEHAAILLVGMGKVGHALFSALSAPSAGGCERVRLVNSRRVQPEDVQWADVVVLTVSDGAIATVAASIAPMIGQTPVLHCAGARDATAANAAPQHGAMHPMVSFCDSMRPPSLTGTALVIDARSTPAALRAAERLAMRMGARPVVAPAQGPSYHAAAAMVANGSAALAVAALPILEKLGIPLQDAGVVLRGLLGSVAANIGEIAGPAALTGPVARGDAATVSAHRASLRDMPDALRVYDAVAPAILACAEAAGLDAAAATAVREVLDQEPRES